MRLAILFLLLSTMTASAQNVIITGGKTDSTNVVVRLAERPAGNHATCATANAWIQPHAEGACFVLPTVKAGEKLELQFAAVKRQSPTMFAFKETAGEHVDVLFGDRPVIRFVNKPHDAKDHYLTFKPFHQMFDPATGKVNLTSGAHPLIKEFTFPHHRGLFFGFNKITYGEKQTADIWHGHKGVYSTFDKMTGTEAGEVFSKHTAAISWHGEDGKAFANEERDVVVYNIDGGTMLDWSTTLSTSKGIEKVKLDGDPQHAGFHFRATQVVAQKTAKQSYYIRPDGKDEPGKTRNWDPKAKDPKTINLPWNALCFVVEGKRYTALRMVHPNNPKDTRGSERDYGRFGDYFEYELTPKTPLKLQDRIWLQAGEMTVEQCQTMYAGFATPPEVKVAK